MSVRGTFGGIDTASMREWCAILDDDNPIHLDPAVADALGFGPRTVNPGPANLAYLLTVLEQTAPGMTPATLDAAFLGNVLAGDTVTAEAVLDGDVARLTLSVAVDEDEADDAGRTVVMAELALRRRDDDGSPADAG